MIEDHLNITTLLCSPYLNDWLPDHAAEKGSLFGGTYEDSKT